MADISKIESLYNEIKTYRDADDGKDYYLKSDIDSLMGFIYNHLAGYVPGFIFCDNRMPNQDEINQSGGEFIIQNPEGEVTSAYYIPGDGIKEGYENPDWTYNGEVVAWRYLA